MAAACPLSPTEAGSNLKAPAIRDLDDRKFLFAIFRCRDHRCVGTLAILPPVDFAAYFNVLKNKD
jgi:hypothetical protein